MSMPTRGYFRMGLECTTGWPSKEQTLEYRGYRITLCPETEQLAPSVLLTMDGSITQLEARRLVQEFLSGLAWVRGGRIVETTSIFATAPVGIGKGMARHISNAPIDYVPSPSDQRGRLALALYREAVSVNAVPYSFLGYFKIVNLLHEKGKDQMQWVNSALPKLTDSRAIDRLTVLRQSHADIGKYLYGSGRCAVAHAYGTPVVNPDDPEHVAQLAADLPLVKALAEYAIEHELGIKSQRTIWDEHLYELEGFRSMWGSTLVGELRSGVVIDPSRFPLPTLVSLRLRGAEILPTFESMRPTVDAAENGVVQLRLKATNGLLEAIVLLDFADERLVFNAMSHVGLADDGTAAAAESCVDLLRFLKRWMANGENEVWEMPSGNLLGRSQPVMLMNLLPDWDRIEAEIVQWDEEAKRRRAAEIARATSDPHGHASA